MSADNTIIVLGTKSSWKREGLTNYRVPERTVYRVGHVQAWDNYDWYCENQPYNLGAYLHSIFKDCIVHEDRQQAMNLAYKMQELIGYVEYGIQVVETDLVFYGD